MKQTDFHKQVGRVFQRFNIFFHLKVLENLMEAPIHVKKIPKKEAVEHALSLLDTVGLSEKREAFPH
jgi:ABC-type polar amino acid transport system ATPase subunit